MIHGTVTAETALDPAVMLATGVHAQPGVYAVLLGSGVSTGAGIPTGWGVVTELVRRAAVAQAPADEDAGARAAEDPEAWWAAHGDGGPLGYSGLLSALAPTGAARRGLLAGFFEPTEGDTDAGQKVPSAAHRAIAQLARRGMIRVIVTTNFDRLMERALEEAGVPPQVVSRPEAVAGLTPLPHAAATVIKLHGDYADLDMRNTVDELETYPPEWNALLDRVFDEYGLVISGWSADWDIALVAALERRRSRRYPFYWDARSSDGETALRLRSQHACTVIPAESADELFTGLLERVDALTKLAEPPLTTAMAITRLKRYLPDPVRRIDLHDFLADVVDRAVAAIRAKPVHRNGLRLSDLDGVVAGYLATVDPVLRLLTIGVYFDRDRAHTDLWIEVIQRLILGRTSTVNGRPYQVALETARHYPALLALRAAGLVAVHLGRDDVFLRLGLEPEWRDPDRGRQAEPAAMALHDLRVLDSEAVNQFPRWPDTRWSYPVSHLLREDLRNGLRPLIPDDAEYDRASDRYEYRLGLLQNQLQDVPGAYQAAVGEFIGEYRWTWGGQGTPPIEEDFRRTSDPDDVRWPWRNTLGTETPEALDRVLLDYRTYLEAARRYR